MQCPIVGKSSICLLQEGPTVTKWLTSLHWEVLAVSAVRCLLCVHAMYTSCISCAYGLSAFQCYGGDWGLNLQSWKHSNLNMHASLGAYLAHTVGAHVSAIEDYMIVNNKGPQLPYCRRARSPLGWWGTRSIYGLLGWSQHWCAIKIMTASKKSHIILYILQLCWSVGKCRNVRLLQL